MGKEAAITHYQEEEALERMVRVYQRPLIAFAYSLVRNMEDAMDIVQTTFLKAYRSYPRLSALEYSKNLAIFSNLSKKWVVLSCPWISED
jgi:DNA-directed RNA polymerase specialized sigma24 family protein